MSLALILVRWLHLSASILLASLFLFEAAILVPAVRKSTTGGLAAATMTGDDLTLAFHKITPGESGEGHLGQSDWRSGLRLIYPVGA